MAYSLTDARVLYELAHRAHPTASEIAQALGLDPGYLSRILRGFTRDGLVTGEPGHDRRQSRLRLTAAGKRAFAPLERRAREVIDGMLQPLDDLAQQRAVDAMLVIREILGDPFVAPARDEPFVLRGHRPGDMGWIIHRHGVLYSHEYGYDETFEALVASVAAEFIQHFKPARARCWIAERRGAIVGSIFVVEQSTSVAKPRLLLVEPSVRGLGLGRRLVDEVMWFAQQAGYGKIVLWTQSELTAARTIYEATGFRRIAEEKHHSFSKDLVAETWECSLR